MVFRPYGPKWKNNGFRCGFVAPQPIRYASQKHILVRSVTYQCSNTSIRWKQGLEERLLKTFETLFLADEVIWALVFFGLGLFRLFFWIIFMCRENFGRLYCWFGTFLELALWPSLSLSFGSWVHFSVFKGTVWYFQNIVQISPRQKQQWTYVLDVQVKFYALLSIFCKVLSSLGPWEYFGICKDWVLEKKISRQSDVPIILVLRGTPTLYIVDEHVISFAPTNTKFQKNALSHII